MKALDTDRLLAQLGSYWFSGVDSLSREKLSLVRDASTASSVHARLLQAERRLRDSEGVVESENILIEPRWTVFEDGGETYYDTEVSPDYLPCLIEWAGREFAIGLDFFIDQITGSIIFYEALDATPPFMVVRRALERDIGTMLHGILFGSTVQPPAGGAERVARYLRGDHTRAGLERAMRALLGLREIQQGGRLLERIEHNRSVVYVFPEERVEVYYAHELLTVGTEYEPGHWIGGEICVVRDSSGGAAWHREFDWSVHGPDMSRAIGIADLKFQDASVTVIDDGGELRFPVTPVGVRDDLFWTTRAQAYTAAGGNGLDEVFSIGDTVNPVDVLFDYFLDHALVVRLDAGSVRPGAVLAMMSWVQRHLPFGYLLIARVTDESGVELNLADYEAAVEGTYPGGSLESLGDGFMVYNRLPMLHDINPLAYR